MFQNDAFRTFKSANFAIPENQKNENEPEIIYLLTAPFDEEAKTGDGQYAASLVKGFSLHSPETDCIWLKAEDGHYVIPRFKGVTPIPEGTLPTVEVLQSVANGRTVLSGYRYNKDASPEDFLPWVEAQTTLATPKMLFSGSGVLSHLFYTRLEDGRTFCLARNRMSMNIAMTDKLLASYETALFQTQKEIDASEQRLREQISVASKKECSRIRSHIEQLKKNHKQLVSKMKASEHWQSLLKTIHEQFQAEQPDITVLTNSLESLSLVASDALAKIDAPLPSLKKPSLSELFKAALSAAQNDPTRQALIKQLIATMQNRAAGRKIGIDIHIRPPQTGAFVTARDIKRFQDAGFIVNLTIHEYKQNYTRPHLQAMTHDLMRQADSVLFFNEKDRKSAIKASQNGFLLTTSLLPNKPLYPIKPYDLAIKARELTVASQMLSGSPENIETILAREPNILCFGTIRPGKGFEEALGLAEEILKRVQAGNDTFRHSVIVAGDPQDVTLMQQLFEQRYGINRMQQLQEKMPAPRPDTPAAQRRDYWQSIKEELENQLHDENQIPENPFLEIVPWCDRGAFEQLKRRCKYVCRIDDMGMRNNGSAIISVLDVGIVYTKWGCVTDEEYLPGGIHAGAVDLGANKYGVNQSQKFFDRKRQTLSSYRRDPGSRPPATILDSIIAREENQKQCENQPALSANYQSIVKAQALLQGTFTLKNSVYHLKKAFAGAKVTLVDVINELPIGILSLNGGKRV